MGAGPSKARKTYKILSLTGKTSLSKIKKSMKKKKRGKNNEWDDHLKIHGEYDNLFEGIDMKDGDESSAIPVWHSQCMPPK